MVNVLFSFKITLNTNVRQNRCLTLFALFFFVFQLCYFGVFFADFNAKCSRSRLFLICTRRASSDCCTAATSVLLLLGHVNCFCWEKLNRFTIYCNYAWYKAGARLIDLVSYSSFSPEPEATSMKFDCCFSRRVTCIFAKRCKNVTKMQETVLPLSDLSGIWHH